MRHNKYVLLTLLLVLVLALTGCDNSDSQSTASKGDKIKTKSSYTAPEVLQAFKDAGLPLGRVEEYTAETDPNELLGRPNRYTGKFNFEDTRQAAPESETLTGGTVEVFDNKKDLDARKTYIEGVTKNLPTFQQYIYVNKNIMLRIDYALTPEQAKEYETVLNNL